MKPNVRKKRLDRALGVCQCKTHKTQQAAQGSETQQAAQGSQWGVLDCCALRRGPAE